MKPSKYHSNRQPYNWLVYNEKNEKSKLIFLKIPYRYIKIYINKIMGKSIYIDISKTRINWFYPVRLSPLYIAAIEYLKYRKKEKVVEVFESLRECYKIYNANELLGLEEYRIFSDQSHPIDAVFPWEKINDINERKKLRLENLRNENLRFGLDSFCYFGDINCSANKSYVEADRIINLISSIENNGFLEYNYFDPIRITILKKERELRYMLLSGNHRVAAVAAINDYYKNTNYKILVDVDTTVDIKNADKWFFVKKGLYPHDVAIICFEKVYNGILPKALKKWERIVVRRYGINVES